MCFLRASHSSRFIKLSPLLCQFQDTKSQNSGQKTNAHAFERHQPENKDYP